MRWDAALESAIQRYVALGYTRAAAVIAALHDADAAE